MSKITDITTCGQGLNPAFDEREAEAALSKTTYSEALAKDRDKLRVQLRKANEQRDKLLAALRKLDVQLREGSPITHKKRDTMLDITQAAIAQAEKGT